MDPLWIASLRGMLAILLLSGALSAWVAPRQEKVVRHRVQDKKGLSPFLYRFLALYLCVAAIWELGGAIAPERFPFAKPFTIVWSLAPPVPEVIRKNPSVLEWQEAMAWKHWKARGQNLYRYSKKRFDAVVYPEGRKEDPKNGPEKEVRKETQGAPGSEKTP